MPAYKQVPVERLHELLEADFEAGTLTWRFRDSLSRGNRVFNGKFAGKKAGNKTPHGYFAVQIDTVHLLVHRVIWAMNYGNWPSAQLDHINHQRSDNRICNLREVYHAENLRNQSPNSKNKSGVNGVFWSHKSQKWHAQIKTGGVCYHLGDFQDIEDAKQARMVANERFGFHKNHGVNTLEVAA